MDDYLQRLLAIDPELARALEDPGVAKAFAEQDERFAAAEWNKRYPRDADRQQEAKIRQVVGPMFEKVLRTIVLPAIAESEARLRREHRSLLRRARLRRWSRKDIDRYVMSKKGLPEEAFKK
jgi:hypothetical protein